MIVKEAAPYELRYRPGWMRREKALYLGVRAAAAVVIILAALYLLQMREYECETVRVGYAYYEECEPLYEVNVLGLVLLCGGIALLIYSYVRTVMD